jgi:hypothetical protein
MRNIYKTVQTWKSQLLEKYYHQRIYGTSDPYSILFRQKPYRILLILSHMRSGSSLLTHILVSNPEIIGFGETHINYESEMKLKALILRVYRTIRAKRMNHLYVLDKVLFNKKILDESIFLSPQIYYIFLVREPISALSSILKIKSDWDETKALAYYLDRLSKLQDYAQSINNKHHALFLTNEQLMNQTTDVLLKLQHFLGIQTPLSEQYQVLKTTGMRGIGDSSENIKAGYILRNRPIHDKALPSPEVVAQGQQRFAHCCITLAACCGVITQPL